MLDIPSSLSILVSTRVQIDSEQVAKTETGAPRVHILLDKQGNLLQSIASINTFCHKEVKEVALIYVLVGLRALSCMLIEVIELLL